MNINQCNLSDPIVSYELSRLKNLVSQNAYLLALAAFQRGLTVTFYNNFHALPRFAQLPVHGLRGELFSVSDGSTTRYFRRTLSDTVSSQVSARCDNKQSTKTILHAANVNVPPGLVITTGKEAEIEHLLNTYQHHQFLLKPLAGSLGEGVVRAIPQERVRDEINKIADRPHLLEVYLRGREFRVYVIGDQVTGCFERVPAHVIGNGERNIESLIAQTNLVRSRHIIYQHYPIILDEIAHTLLSQQGLSLNTIPERNQKVWLSEIPSYMQGGLLQSTLPSKALIETCLKAARVMEINFTGIDVILLNSGTDHEQAVVLEMNQCPYITAVLGDFAHDQRPAYNTIAEALIDYHFPHSVSNTRFPQACFDLVSIINLLETGAAANVTLPTLNPGWIHIRRSYYSAQVEDILLTQLVKEIRYAGLHVRVLKTEAGTVWADGVIPDHKLDHLDALLRSRHL